MLTYAKAATGGLFWEGWRVEGKVRGWRALGTLSQRGSPHHCASEGTECASSRISGGGENGLRCLFGRIWNRDIGSW